MRLSTSRGDPSFPTAPSAELVFAISNRSWFSTTPGPHLLNVSSSPFLPATKPKTYLLTLTDVLWGPLQSLSQWGTMESLEKITFPCGPGAGGLAGALPGVGMSEPDGSL